MESRGFEVAGVDGVLSGSAGIVASTGTDFESAEELFEKAQDALAVSRKWGGNRFTVWSPEAEKTLRS